ncbi:MAG: NADP-dependent oxidoreductase [Kofleriaceae bacterium]|nr:NADP-dependent oxidoreductase [Kofleriaceae bacterium]
MVVTEEIAELELLIALTERRALVTPDTMTAEAIDQFGPPGVLQPHWLPVPKLAPTEVLIEMRAAGVGSWDAMIREGVWAPDRVEFPLVLGTDGAGIVVAKGSEVDQFDIGDRVWACDPKGGFYAEYVAVDADKVGPVPPELDLLHAGTACIAALTAMQGIFDHLDVRHYERVLIFGASGAVGSYAVQLAKRRGAFVIGTATGHDAQELVHRLGADAVIDVRDIRGRARLAQFDLDAVLALAGGDLLEQCIDHVRPTGRIAYPVGVEPPPKHQLRLHWYPYDAVGTTEELTRLARVFADADLHVPIAALYPLGHGAKAHRRLEKGHVRGRIVLRVPRREER